MLLNSVSVGKNWIAVGKNWIAVGKSLIFVGKKLFSDGKKLVSFDWNWIPAFAGMTGGGVIFDTNCTNFHKRVFGL